uniref:glycosyltransferase family 2 protein n=1 Tax=Clostridium sp. 12(A) TaxID=1163671 RepID=UPI00046505D7|nr:glycosyltransferase family 2 protein [Clostridium sp. 12(A)]
MKILTIVVPVYNVEKYLDQCLKSFVISEILDKLEVLIINDGSCDSSSTIGQTYVNEYPDTFRMITKENGGHGSTINVGIQEATGKYFKVVDGDDWVNAKGVRSLVKLMDDLDVDMVLSNYYWVDDITGKKSKEIKEICSGIEYGTVIPFQMVSSKIFFKMHAISYRTEILKKIPERIDEHCYYVDLEYITFPIPYIKTIAAIPDYVYMYRVGQAAQSVSIENMQKRCAQHEKVVNCLLKYFNQNRSVSNEIKDCMAEIIARSVTSQYKIYLSFKNSHKKDIIHFEKILKEQYHDIYEKIKNPAVSILRLTNYITYDLISIIVRFAVKSNKT